MPRTASTLKQQLLAECRRIQQEKVDTARQAMLEVQESAQNTETAEEAMESFREVCHRQRDQYARQQDEALTGLQVLRRVPEAKTANNQPGLGSVVVTDSQRFYVSLSLGEIEVEGEPYFALSAFSPLFQAMAQSQSGDSFEFRGKSYQIREVL
jgi:hypothetical protein